MKYACRYAIVRFMPYPETGEFANVGVVVMSPEARYFGFQFIERRVARVTAFFEELDPTVYRNAQRAFIDELTRLRIAFEHRFARHDVSPSEIRLTNALFDEMTRPREAIMYLDDPRIILAEDPEQGLGQLFDTYVARSFTANPMNEKVIEKRVKAILKAADLDPNFHEETLGAGQFYRARFPFVKFNKTKRPVRAIKPINLAHDDPSQLYAHGWEWVGKVRLLRKFNLLPEHVLFAAEAPTQKFGPQASAFAEIKFELEQLDVDVVRPSDEDKIIEFAEANF
jgi:Protein of unknown function (DUF3037)